MRRRLTTRLSRFELFSVVVIACPAAQRQGLGFKGLLQDHAATLGSRYHFAPANIEQAAVQRMGNKLFPEPSYQR